MGVDEFLRGLSPEQLSEVRTKALFLLRRRENTEADSLEELYDQMREMLLGRGVAAPPYPQFRLRSKRVGYYDETAKSLRVFVDKYLKPRTKLERMRAYQIMVESVDRRLQAQGIPRSLQTMLNLLPKAPSLLEFDFPGYLETGLLPQVLLRPKKV